MISDRDYKAFLEMHGGPESSKWKAGSAMWDFLVKLDLASWD